MAQTTPPAVTALPPAPQTSDGAALFASKADTFVAALVTFRTQVVALAANVYDNCVDAWNSAIAAAASAAAALASQVAAASSAATAAAATGAPLWVSGTTYAIGNPAWSPVSGLTYRRLTNGAGATDPSADPTNWLPIAFPSPQIVRVTGTSVTAQKQCVHELANVAATTLTLPASAAAGDVFWIAPLNGLYTNVVARNGHKIMGLSEDMTLDNPHLNYGLRYVDATYGWRLV